MRYALSSLLFAGLLAFAGCGGGGLSDTSSLRVRCLGGQAFCIVSCDLGCTSNGCSVTEIAENQRLRFKFSDAVDPTSVNGSSISIRTATGVAPDGDFEVSGNVVTFVPKVSTVNGVSSFGFQRNETYIITLAGGNSIAQSVTNLAGDGLSSEFTCTVVASLGIQDEDQQPPTVELVSPTTLVGAPVNPTIVLRFSELIDTTPLQVPLSEASPIRVVLRGTLPSGLCDSEAEGIALEGVPQLSTELVGSTEVTVVTYQPSVQLPGNSCLTVRVTADLRDLSGRSAVPAKFVILTEAGVSTPITITETFADDTNQEALVSGGVWGGVQGPGARPGLIGGDGRHGSFDAAIGTALGNGVYVWDTSSVIIPATQSLTGQQYEVLDGRFFFTDMVIPETTTLRIVGPNPPVFHVRGRCDIQGRIEVNGVSLPGVTVSNGPAAGMEISAFNARNNPGGLGQQGTSGGPGGGRGGNGGREGDNTGPIFQNGINLTEGQPGQDVRLAAGHAYAGNTLGTGGAGSVMTPASGVWGTPVPLLQNIYCGYFSTGGAGGGFSSQGGQAATPQHAMSLTIVSEPTVPGGAMFDLMPYPPVNPPANYSSLDHFMVGGSGGGGGGSHGYGLLAIGAALEKWMAGHAGTGGGGTFAVRAGGDLVVGATAVLQSIGGSGVIINGDNPGSTPGNGQYGISSPGGAGSGGSFLLQSGRDLSFAGLADTSGGHGCTNGFITNNLLNMTGGGGDGSPGFYRLEAAGNLSFGGSGIPAFEPSKNGGTLLDRDDLSGDTSKWYTTQLIFPPTWLRYELDVDTDGDGTIDITYTDSGEPGTQQAYEPNGPVTLPVVIQFQGANLNQAGTEPVEGSVGPWRPGIGSGGGQGISLDSVTGFRFTMTYNRAMFPDMVVRGLRVFAQT
ncbi:MAG TPA: hypothetical protein ENI87_06360 [bacterium]|nr:hypothetical protein [bacterium]